MSIPLSCATSSIPPFPASSDAESTGNLPSKLDAISKAGFQGIELAFPDLVAYSTELEGHDVDAKDFDTIVKTAKRVQSQCKDLDLKVMMLQPFANWEGWETGSKETRDAEERADGWIRVMEAVGTDMIQVGSTDAEGISMDRNRLAEDVGRFGEKLAKKGFKLCYENWAWSTHAPTWRDVDEIVKMIGKENVGLCLDTFQTAGYEWGDPTTKSGKVEGEEVDKTYQKSLESLSTTIPADKIFVLQVSDAYRPPKPLDDKPDENGLRPRGRWSSKFRPMPGKEGGYLPIIEMGAAVLKTGFRGWFSLEIFDGGPRGTGIGAGDSEEWAKKAKASMDAFILKCKEFLKMEEV